MKGVIASVGEIMLVDPGEGRLPAPARLGIDVHGVDSGHHEDPSQKAQRMSDDTAQDRIWPRMSTRIETARKLGSETILFAWGRGGRTLAHVVWETRFTA